MEIPYSRLQQSTEISTLGPEHDEARTPAAVLAVSAHIRSFYRLFLIIAFLLVLSGVGTTAIIVGYVKSNSCPASRNISRTLSIIGIVDIIMCGIIAIIVTARVTCCYHRSTCLCSFLFVFVQFLCVVLAIAILFMNINDGRKDFSVEYQTTNPSVTKNCEKIVEYFLLVIQIILLSLWVLAFSYTVFNNWKKRCQKNVTSGSNSTTIV